MKLLPAFLASASAFYSGGCGDEINPSGAKCATECPGITQQGRGQKIKFKLKEFVWEKYDTKSSKLPVFRTFTGFPEKYR